MRKLGKAKEANNVMGGKILKLPSEISEEQAEERTAKMLGWLASSDRYGDIIRAAHDREARAQFFAEFYALYPSEEKQTIEY